MIDGSPMAAGDNAPPTGHSKGGADSFATGQLMMDRRGKLASEDRGGSSDVAAVEINAANLVQRSSKMADNTVNRGEHVPSVSSSLIGLDERRRFGHKMIRSSGSGGGGNLDSSANELLPDQQEQQQEHQKQEQQRTDGSQSAPQLTSLVEMTPASRRNRRLKCRVEKDLYLDFEEYQHYTCAHCYNQVPPEYFNNKLGLVREEGRMIRLEDRESEQPIWTNETARIKLTFKVEEKFEKWQICCRQAVECCQENAKYLPTTVANDPDNEDDDDTDNNNANHNNDELPLVDDPKRNECPGTWDGLSCWGPSAAGRLAWRECPRVAYLLDFEPACRGYVTKQCFQNASWFINRNGHEWSDYSACSPEGLYKARMLHASVAYVCEALIVVPALLIIGKFPNRGGNKRIRIMKSLLFYILLNSLIQALQRGFLAAGYFAEYRGGPHRVEHHSSSRQQLHQSQQEQQQQQQQQQRQLLLDQRQEQPAVPTKLALISSEGPQQNAARNELIPSSLTSSASLIDQQARSGGGGNDGETGPFERQTRLHARSAGSVELDDAMTTSLTELPRDNGVDETNYYEDLDLDNDEDANEETETETEMEEQNDPGGQYDGSELDDDDDDDDQNELVERIFLTAPKRPFAQPIRLDGGRHHRVVGVQIDQANRRLEDNRLVAPRPTGWPKELEIFGLPSRTLLNSRNGVRSKLSSQSQSGDHISSKYQLISTQETDPKLNNNSIETNYPATATEQDGSDQEDRRPLDIHVPRKEATETPTNTRRHKRNSTTTTTATTTAVTTDNNNNNSQDRRFQPQIARFRRKESAWKAFFCWFLQMASRLVRLMSYAWMFTGGVYLCSALHFAPAEPPAKFIKILFFLTNAFPNLIFFAYVTARTINEPSPLNIIIKAPYYWFRGDEKQIEQLYETQKVCWFEESKSQSIEDIADLPNLILVAANVALFVITLVILCRINRPGSTRPDMSPCAYFKAAGTLLFLYGGHYFFLAYRPESESCSVDTFMFYAFICIDVVQGIAISIVFCYMTQEGKSVIVKYWRNRHRFTPFKQLRWLSCFGDKYKLADNGYHHTPYNAVRLNHSLRSNTSACNGHNDNVTELVNINDTQVSGHF